MGVEGLTYDVPAILRERHEANQDVWKDWLRSPGAEVVTVRCRRAFSSATPLTWDRCREWPIGEWSKWWVPLTDMRSTLIALCPSPRMATSSRSRIAVPDATA
jgi:hypothetical protein